MIESVGLIENDDMEERLHRCCFCDVWWREGVFSPKEVVMTEKANLLLRMLIRLVLSVGFFLLLLFLPAGTWNYTAAWMYLGVMYGFMLLVTTYFFFHDPAFLERRMKMKEKEQEQKILIKISAIVYLAAYLIPGFDFRYGWSQMSFVWVVVGNLLVFLGYLLVFLVFRANSYAARTVEVEAGQKLVSTGPYALVRHPMYTGVLLMFLATPLALGSYWMFLPASLLPWFLYFRILNEEKVLREQLDGYVAYCERVRFRMIPYVW